MLKFLNNYFFGEDEIALSDALFYYGSLVFMMIVLFGVALPAWLQLP